MPPTGTVVIFLSDKRSGSTIFQSEICKHSLVAHVDYTPHTYFETQHWLKGARLLDLPKQTFYRHRYPSSLQSKSSARNYTRECLAKNLPDFDIPDDDKKLVFDGWEVLCKKFANPVFFEKSPQHIAQWGALSLILEWIKSTQFDVRIIGMVRNPLSVMYSADKLFTTDPKVRQFGWADMYRNLLAMEALLNHDQFLLLRYEDMIANPPSIFARACEFIGIPFEKAIGSDVHIKSKNKWLDDQDYDVQLDDTVKQIARHFGYSEQELHNPDKPGIAIGKRVARKIEHSFRLAKAKLVNGIIKPAILGTRFKK